MSQPRFLKVGGLALLCSLLGCVDANNDLYSSEDDDIITAEADLAAPSKLQASVQNGAVKLSWTAVPKAVGYYVRRKDVTANTAWTRIAKLPASTLTYTDSGVKAGNTYQYYVRGYDKRGNGGKISNTVTITVGTATCTPTTCAEKGADCGSIPDGCGGSLNCGSCASPSTCGGGGTPNVCGTSNTCVPKTCASLEKNCGSVSDGCGGTLNCGSCTSPATCGGGGVPNVCGTGTTTGGTSTPANFKVAFIGDTGSSSNFTQVLNLVKAEGAQLLLVQGDLDYSNNPSAWINTVNKVLGPSFPMISSRGNHDDVWSGYLPDLASRQKANNIVLDDPNMADEHYSTIWNGLSMVFIGENRLASYPNYIRAEHNNNNIWKICSWHKNQNAMQLGGKGDEMGWEVYEACREMGAIIVTGHEHSYSRTKTLISMSQQTVDPSCSSGSSICVAKGKTMAVVSGLGGIGIRDQNRCLTGCKGEWAKIYTSTQSATFGAMFITFHVDGDPRKARGYFKNINGQIVDTFDITAQ